MIEMRWVPRPEFAIEYGDGVTRTVKVLQYRQYKDPHQYEDFGWSDWIDVPTVTEE